MALTVGKVLTKVFGSRNERLLKRYSKLVGQVNAREADVRKLTDPELRARTQEIRDGLVAGRLRSEDVIPEAFAIIRESMDRHIGIRSIFDPENNFDPDQLDDEMLEAYDQVQRQMINTGESWRRVAIPPKMYDAIRKLYPESRPPFRARCFDVQLIGGIVLYEGRIAEMATGEGKTFVAPLACFLRVLQGFHAHVVTVNDYLVRRDATWMQPAFENLGLSVGFLQSDMEPGGTARRSMYECDITYGTNSEFGFDYLRDNMKERVDLQVQGPLDFAIVDEIDQVLIDEARTPLIISGAAHDDAPKYVRADAVARKVMELSRPWDAAEAGCDAAKRAIKAAEGDAEKGKTKDEKEAARQRRVAAEKALAAAEAGKDGLTQYYEVEWDRKSVHLTHEGIAAAQDAAGVGSFFVGNNLEWPHLMEQAMRAHVVYERDKEYVVERNGRTGQMEVVIVDEFTGRKMTGRQWSDGLHQAVEAKERVPIKEETQTLATITLQNFFKLYKKLSGMTGTAQTEAEEFDKIYKLEIVTIPTNRPRIRADFEDRVYRSEREKWEAIVEEIKEQSDAGRPVLVGTTSVEKSEMLSSRLQRKHGIEHEVLNAKQNEREAQIIALAGLQHANAHAELVGNVTIATNMAGRGTDIKPAPEAFYNVVKVEAAGKGEHRYTLKQRGAGAKELVVEPDSVLVHVFQLNPQTKVVGGLHVIGTERHTARRIDNQLRGRSGRQGDPGSSRFYVSLEDELMKMFAGEWTIKVLGWLGMEEGMAIEDARITKGIVRAQKKVEERNYLARKNLLEYDEVNDHHRGTFYGMRQKVLEGKAVDQVIWEMIGDAISDAVDKYVTRDYVAATAAEWARVNFEVSLDPEDLKGRRNLQELEHYVKEQAKNEAVTNIASSLGEFMGEDADDKAGWDTKSLSGWVMSRFGVQISQNQIRQMDAEALEDRLRVLAIEQIEQRDASSLQKYLEPQYAERELSGWAAEKFGVDVAPAEMFSDPGMRARRTPDEIARMIEERARAAYARRQVEYPIDHTLTFAFGGSDAGTDNPYAADYVRQWAAAKYAADVPLEHIHQSSVRQLRDHLIGLQERFLNDGELERTVDAMLAESGPNHDALAKAASQRFGTKVSAKELESSTEPGQKSRQPMRDVDGDAAITPRDHLLAVGRRWLRKELTDLEQYVLIQIFDQSWKDHLYAMDMLKSGIGLQAFAEKDPRVLFKKEGYAYFQQMMAGIRDRVTDLIFRARVVGQAETKSNYRETAASHQMTDSYGVAETVVPEVQAEQAAAAAASGNGDGGGGAAAAVTKPITRNIAKVGRNDPCPCGSGKKYKNCCGANAA